MLFKNNFVHTYQQASLFLHVLSHPHSVVLGQVGDAVRDHALAELDLPAGAAAVTAQVLPLLEWGTMGCDCSDDHQNFPSAQVGGGLQKQVR